jgi:hypothetical protein
MSQEESAVTRARVLLCGYVRHDKRGLSQTVYLKPDEELAGRTALARLLRNPHLLTGELCQQLAALFDPEADTHPAIERKLVFRHRGRGNRPQPMRNTQIARYVWDRFRSDWGVERAVEAAMEKYELSREAIYGIWSRYRPLFEALDEPFDAPE